MKLLIVDDEELTRTGLITSIDWPSLGIHKIYQADDGLNGLELAKLYRPEIILCDVRMPRMDGITMLEKLESILPGTIPIFMSGFSDKQYLKAAIKLKAVSYIEKPLNPAEVREAVLEAKEIYQQKMRSDRGAAFHSLETAARLALQLTVPYGANADNISLLAKELSLSFSKSTCFTAFIVRPENGLEYTDRTSDSISSELRYFLRPFHLDCIYAEKRGQYIIFFVFGDQIPSTEVIHRCGALLNSMYQGMGSCYITAGETVTGIHNAYHSYSCAVILLQSSFFFPENTFLTAEQLNDQPDSFIRIPDEPDSLFGRILSEKDAAAADSLLNQLFHFYYQNGRFLQNQVKDLYYKLFLTLISARRQLLHNAASDDENISDTLEDCFSYENLHQNLVDRTRDFFKELEHSIQETPVIQLIKEYISQNYMKETLSVKDISAHAFLSASYVCTYFKNETGQTLNQYLTEFRMEKAKQLLSDPRYKITDISSKVGYSDGNYFGKSFKKYSGLSPSEYREKILK